MTSVIVTTRMLARANQQWYYPFLHLMRGVKAESVFEFRPRDARDSGY